MTFTASDYERIRAGCISSAAVIVPLLDRWFRPTTVVDVGAGEGWFCEAFRDRGATVLAIERPIPDPRAADVRFSCIDLSRGIPAIGPFDLALCLEVAEHLPETSAEGLVDGLCGLAPVVVFSAAIPGQGGHRHVNEQWPAYWARMFEARGYIGSGALRYEIWNDARVEPWYRQNLCVYVQPGEESGNADTLELFAGELGELGSGDPLPLVHPDIYGWRLSERDEARGAYDSLAR